MLFASWNFNSGRHGSARRQEQLKENGQELTPRGTVPHNQPSQGAGMAFDSIRWAGGTSSLDQAVTWPLSKISIFRKPTKVSSGS